MKDEIIDLCETLSLKILNHEDCLNQYNLRSAKILIGEIQAYKEVLTELQKIVRKDFG